MNSLCNNTKLFNKIYRPTFWSVHRTDLNTTRCNNLFWESDPKGGYSKDNSKLSPWSHIKNGWIILKEEFKLFKKEITEKIESDPILFYKPGVVDKQWILNKEENLKEWIVSCDSDHGEGFSCCSLTINGQGHGLFCGLLDTSVPKDGRIKRAGYCSIRTVRVTSSFRRNSYHDWCPYTHLVLRVRGDGRSYLLNIATSGYFDQLWNDMYHYVLFTRGGPYWQVTKIPFSKFFFSSKGRIQDLQEELPLDKITNFGITICDKISGPFSLEIDYVGVESNPLHDEVIAYEMYTLPKNIAAN